MEWVELGDVGNDVTVVHGAWLHSSTQIEHSHRSSVVPVTSVYKNAEAICSVLPIRLLKYI